MVQQKKTMEHTGKLPHEQSPKMIIVEERKFTRSREGSCADRLGGYPGSYSPSQYPQ